MGLKNDLHKTKLKDAGWNSRGYLPHFDGAALPQFILHSIKSYTSHEANKLLQRTGQFWIEDYFDRYIRDEEHFQQTVDYIEMNPVKARLCAKPEDWPFSSAWFKKLRKG